MNNILIRTASQSDLNKLKQSFPSDPHELRLKTQENRKSTYLIALLGGSIVGSICIWWKEPFEKEVREYFLTTPTLYAAAVVEKYRSRGIGTALIRECEKLIKENGINQVALTVGVENERAINLYKRLGYINANIGVFKVEWPEIMANGQTLMHFETCMCLLKNL